MKLCAAILILALLSVGCDAESESLLPASFGACPEADPMTSAEPPDAPTYHRDVRAIIARECLGCHSEGGVGPFVLETHAQVAAVAPAIAWAVSADSMPPWPPNPCCASYARDRSLTPLEKATLLAWIEDGAPEGDPADAPPTIPPVSGLSRVDLTLTMAAPFTPEISFGDDELRCFLLDWPYDDKKFITGLEVVPGNLGMVHHALVHAVTANEAKTLARLDAEDAREGWDCYGQGVPAHASTGLGGWAPGYQGYEYPTDLGVGMEPGSKVLLNVHYDLSKGAAEDQTQVKFKIEDSVEREAENLVVSHPLWLIDDGMRIPAGDPDVMYRFSYDPSDALTDGEGFDIYGVSLHMHERGSSASLGIRRANGEWVCLLDIPDFDFNWQGDYVLSEPIRYEAGDELYVECHWDNSEGNQRVINGERETPRDLIWGTDQEMCSGFLMISRR